MTELGDFREAGEFTTMCLEEFVEVRQMDNQLAVVGGLFPPRVNSQPFTFQPSSAAGPNKDTRYYIMIIPVYNIVGGAIVFGLGEGIAKTSQS